MRVIKSIQVEYKDIAIIERLHDMLLDKYGVPLNHQLLKESRKLTSQLNRMMQEVE